MSTDSTKQPTVIIIGAGIAGLSAGIYAQMNGYKSRIYEMHNLPGGLMTAWKRKGFTIDGCIHWLTGSSPAYPGYYRWWQEIGLIQNREIFDPEIFTRIESCDGKVLNLYTNIDRLEQHLLELAPEDGRAIRSMCAAMRAFTTFQPSSDEEKFFTGISNLLRMVPILPHIIRWGRLSMKQLGAKFKNPFLRETFTNLWYPEMSAVGLLVTLALMNNKGAGYTMGGSLPMAHAVEKRYCDLGGDIFYNTKIEKILVDPTADGKSRATGVQLSDGSIERADFVISAADGHATLYNMLGEQFVSEDFKQLYSGSTPIFEPVVFIGLGVNRTFKDLPACTGGISYELDEPVIVSGQPLKRVEAMFYNFDPSMAPTGKTVITVMIPSNYKYWKDLYGDGSDRERYETEKQRVAIEVIRRLEKHFPGLEGQVEMADVATPLTFEHYTGNWQGSFEGWLPTPKLVTKSIPKTLPGLDNFYMAGQWVQPGGGLPSGVMTGRDVVKRICKKDGKKFSASIE